MGLNPATVSADFPWNRLFEINALVSSKPRYKVYLTRAEQQRIAEEKAAAEAKAKAEAEAKAKAAAKAAAKAEAPSPAPAAPSSDEEKDGDISSIVINK